MKILSILNISNKDNISCDSGYIFQCILSKQFEKMGHKYVVAGANCPEFKQAKELKCKKEYINLGTNKFSSRFDFNSDEIAELIRKVKPDVIFNTQIELTSAIRSVLIWNKLNIPIVTYCHYPALWANNIKSRIPEIDQSLNAGNLGNKIVFDILTALQTSDLFVIQSKFAKSLIVKAAKYYNIPYDSKKIIVIAPPADPSFLDKKNKYITTLKNRKNYIYNHRLYKTYGTQDFIDIFDGLHKQFGIQCVVLDPMQKRSQKRASQNNTPADFVKIMSKMPGMSIAQNNKTRAEYKSILNSGFACFAPLRKACVWSMACMDCMGLGIPVIAPNMAAFPEFVPQSLLYKNKRQLNKIISKLQTNNVFVKQMSEQCFKSAHEYSPEKIAEQLSYEFNKLVNK